MYITLQCTIVSLRLLTSGMDVGHSSKWCGQAGALTALLSLRLRILWDNRNWIPPPV